MNKKLYIPLTFVLVVLLVIGVIVGTIMNGPQDSSSNSSNIGSDSTSSVEEVPNVPRDTITPRPNEPVPNTVHEINVVPSSYDFFVSGTTQYKIVIPKAANKYEELAASEVQLFIEQATSFTMDILVDEGIVFDSSSKYISLGDTTLAPQANLSVNKEELTASGYRIISKDQSVFVLGGGPQGTLYGAYEFLKHTIDFAVYAEDEITYKTNVSNVKLSTFDVKDVPDIAWRTKNYGVFDSNIMFAQRMRLSLQEDIWITVGGNSWHNSFNYIDPVVYGAAHPEWFNADKTQLDYTNDEMRAELTRKLIEVVDANPNLNNITITQQDYNTWSNSAKNQELRMKYGTDSASMIIFANQVSRSLKSHFQSSGSNRVVEIAFFAYQRTETAPAKYDAVTDTYSPIDELVKCDENVNVFYAPIFADYNVSVYNPLNKSLYDVMRAWTSVTDKFYLWTYSTNFTDYLAFFNSFDSMQSVYKFAKESNAYYIYDQGQWNNPGTTGFGALKNYLNPMLQWNVNLNMEELTNDWFTHYFKDASTTMRDLFDQIRTHYVYLNTETSMSHSIYVEMAKSGNFSKGLLDKWVALIEKAHTDILPLKDTDPALYQRLSQRIEQEFVFVGYVLVEAYSAAYSPTDLLELKKRVRSAATDAGITMYQEVSSISDIWTKWGI